MAGLVRVTEYTSKVLSSSGTVCVFILRYKWNGIECIIQHRDIYGDDGSVSRRRSNIYINREDEDEGNNKDDADLGGEDKDADIDWGMMTMGGPL